MNECRRPFPSINPLDVKALTPSKPMVRTHPITGWKVVWGFGFHVRHIDDVTEAESQELLAKITGLVSNNHDLQVRFRWSNSGDMGKLGLTAAVLSMSGVRS